MLNRRILRIKAFKELFAVEMQSGASLARASKELDTAIESTRDLYLFMLASITPLVDVAKSRLDRLSLKINKTEEEKHPNLKFVENALCGYFESDADFAKLAKKKSLDWGAFELILQKIYASVQTKQYYIDYMASDERSIAADCRLFENIFVEEFVDREDLAVVLEDRNIYWNDDLPYALTWCCRAMQDIADGKRWRCPELYLSSLNPKMDDDCAFVHKLFRESFLNYDRYCAAIGECIPNWDKDRLVATDIAIIVTALSEIVYFPEIPVNVTINEYVEISKFFGTSKSSVFVNGILDAMSKKKEFQKNFK